MILLVAAAALAAAPADCAAGEPAPTAICKALAAQQEGQPATAAEQFEAAAAALPATDPRRDRALAAAGNMWIAANEPGKAAFALDKALAGKGLEAEQRGEALLDRARAAEAQDDLKTARAKATEAAATISKDPFYWYFSAALAIREGDQAIAKSAIGRALTLAPNDPTILFEAGHVAQFTGDLPGARSYWQRAATAGQGTPVAAAAREAIALLDKPAPNPAPVKSEPKLTK
jgi:tetratricopeptide (TPR) repeat protein